MAIPRDLSVRTERESGALQDTLTDLVSRLNSANRKLVEDLIHRLISLQQLENPNAEPYSRGDLRDHLATWLNHLQYQSRSPVTIRVYTLFVNELLTMFPQPTQVLIEAYLATKTATGTSPNSIASRIAAFKSFFGHLTQVGILNSNPAEHLKNPRIPFRARTLPPDEDLAALFNSPHTTTRDKALLHLGVGCGLRVHEATSLKVSDVDFKHLEVTVIGKGNKQRTVAMPRQTAEALILHLGDLVPGSRWLFPGEKPKSPLSTYAAIARLHKLCDLVGIEQITPHQLRHWFTTTLLNDGANLKDVAAMLGHSTPEPTARIYWHLKEAKAQHSTMEKHNPVTKLLGQKQRDPEG
jgi:site-specific recombinase XerD